MTSSASDFLVEKQLQKCQMCVTFSFLLNRSLEWSPLRRERKARPSFCHPAGKATCLLRAGVTMSTRLPMVSPLWGASCPSPRGSVSLEGQFSPPASTSWFLDFSFRNQPQRLLSPLGGCGWWGSEPGLGRLPFKTGVIPGTHQHAGHLMVWNGVFQIEISKGSLVNSWFKSS